MNKKSVELQFELKALEFTPYNKQGQKCIEMLEQARQKRIELSQVDPLKNLEITSQLRQSYVQIQKEITTFFKIIAERNL